MQKFAASILCCLLFQTLYAANTAPKHVAVNVDLRLEQRDQVMNVKQYNMKATLDISTRNHNWTVVLNKFVNNPDGFILLSKIENSNAKEIAMKFLLIDARKKPAIISAPEMIILYGQKGQIILDEPKEKMQLSIIASAL